MNTAETTRGDVRGKGKVHTLISSELIRGTKVYNLQKEHLGTVISVMIDKYSGQVAYAVMSFGGFLGIGEKFHPLPWHVLKYEQDVGGYVIDLDKDRLLSAPSYALTDP